MHRIFVSYNHKDRKKVGPIVHQLQAAGLDVWFDTRNIELANSWTEEVLRALNECNWAIIAIGQHGIGETQREEMRRLCSRELRREVQIVPVVLRGTRRGQENVPVELRDFHRLDMREPGAMVEQLVQRMSQSATPAVISGSNVDWAAFEEAFHRVVAWIQSLKTKEQIDMIIGLADGRIAAAMIAANIAFPEHYVMDVPVEHTAEGRRVDRVAGTFGDLRGKRVLLVDNHVYTGYNMKVACDHLRSLGVAGIRKVVLFQESLDWLPERIDFAAVQMEGKRKYWPWSLTEWHQRRYGLPLSNKLPQEVVLDSTDVTKLAQTLDQALDQSEPAAHLKMLFKELAARSELTKIDGAYAWAFDVLLSDARKNALARATFELFTANRVADFSLPDHLPVPEAASIVEDGLPRIATLALSCALDLDVDLRKFTGRRDERERTYMLRPSGKAINVALGLSLWHESPLVFGMVGGETGRMILSLLREKNIPTNNLKFYEADTRINLGGIRVQKKKDPMRLSCPATPVPPELWQQVARETLDSLRAYDILVVSGSFPHGVSLESFGVFLTETRAKGLRVFLDTKDAEFVHVGLRHGLHLLGINLREFCEVFSLGEPMLRGDRRAVASECMKVLEAHPLLENVCVSMGEHGAVFVNRSQVLVGRPPDIKCVSSVAAGDSIKIALAYGLRHHMSEFDAFALALAASAATTELKGAATAELEHSQRLLRHTTVESTAWVKLA